MGDSKENKKKDMEHAVSQDPYKRNYHSWPLERMARTLKENLKFKGEPIAIAWRMEVPHGTEPYTGDLKLVHCQFMQRSRLHGETFILDVDHVDDLCAGYSYIGLGEPPADLESGYNWSRREDGNPAIYGSPGAARRVKEHYHGITPGTVKYFCCAPLSDCPFDPDVVILVADPKTCVYAARAAIHYRGGVVEGITGPGTCSATWINTYLSGQIRYTLGCRGVFCLMGVDATELCLSIPIETLPEICQNLEEWSGYNFSTMYPLYGEGPTNEETEWMKVPYEGPYKNPPLAEMKQEDES